MQLCTDSNIIVASDAYAGMPSAGVVGGGWGQHFSKSGVYMQPWRPGVPLYPDGTESWREYCMNTCKDMEHVACTYSTS